MPRRRVQRRRTQLQQAELSLGYKTIARRSRPSRGGDGHAAATLLDRTAQRLLTPLSQPIDRVNFPLSEGRYVSSHVKKNGFAHLEGRRFAGTRQSCAARRPPGVAGVRDRARDGRLYPHRRRESSVNRQIDATTRTTQLQGAVPNPDGVSCAPRVCARARSAAAMKARSRRRAREGTVSGPGQYSVAEIGPGNPGPDPPDRSWATERRGFAPGPVGCRAGEHIRRDRLAALDRRG